ncbi:hypothetical protein [Sandaracinus amylolyticus]|uniref:hypothetical protein n=1 Tax=Sandaracinus amylolyticus TaxID=927083 RepID=UPI001F37C06E|nr:hypothetical protein [Sandaracinus amylolyticus]UJR80158.1 Hypothetical protein I5071_22020 [Sandaracinus amylolyticus]
MSSIFRSAFLVLAICAGVLASGAQRASAQSLSCETIQAIADIGHDLILGGIDARVAGTQVRLTRRKDLVIHGVESLSVSGCVATLRFGVTLKRDIRRDAHGTVEVRGNVAVTPLRPGAFRVCITSPRVTDVDLSRTTEVGEFFYERFANWFIPEGTCTDVSL